MYRKIVRHAAAPAVVGANAHTGQRSINQSADDKPPPMFLRPSGAAGSGKLPPPSVREAHRSGGGPGGGAVPGGRGGGDATGGGHGRPPPAMHVPQHAAPPAAPSQPPVPAPLMRFYRTVDPPPSPADDDAGGAPPPPLADVNVDDPFQHEAALTAAQWPLLNHLASALSKGQLVHGAIGGLAPTHPDADASHNGPVSDAVLRDAFTSSATASAQLSMLKDHLAPSASSASSAAPAPGAHVATDMLAGLVRTAGAGSPLRDRFLLTLASPTIDEQPVLVLGSGWGHLSVHLAQLLPRSTIVSVASPQAAGDDVLSDAQAHVALKGLLGVFNNPVCEHTVNAALGEFVSRISPRVGVSELPHPDCLVVVGCWLLAAGCWLLAAGCWLLAAVCWLLLSGPVLCTRVSMLQCGACSSATSGLVLSCCCRCKAWLAMHCRMNLKRCLGLCWR